MTSYAVRTRSPVTSRAAVVYAHKNETIDVIKSKLSATAVQEAAGTAIHRRDLPTRSLKDAVRDTCHSSVVRGMSVTVLRTVSVSQFVNANDNAY